MFLKSAEYVNFVKGIALVKLELPNIGAAPGWTPLYAAFMTDGSNGLSPMVIKRERWQSFLQPDRTY